MLGFVLPCTISYLLLFGANGLSVPSGNPQRQKRSRSGQSRKKLDNRGASGDNDNSSGPKSESMRSRRRSRGSAREQEVFDPQKVINTQKSNENAIALDLYDLSHQRDSSFIRRRSSSSVVQVSSIRAANVLVSEDGANGWTADSNSEQCKGPIINHAHFEYLSLDQLFPGIDFGKRFSANGDFRQAIRVAMRGDIFFTTPAYADVSSKIAAMMLDDDSSLQGTWNCIPKNLPEGLKESAPLRMTRLTRVLQTNLGPDAPTGDDFMIAIGGLCGKNPSTHWIDIIGVKDRAVSHSWHQDTGISYVGESKLTSSKYTVMLGFPVENKYCGCGVFSHAIKLKHEHLAPEGHNENEPVLFEGSVDDEFIIRPKFSLGQEVLRYRDVDVLHSAPDAVYRKSVMRFM